MVSSTKVALDKELVHLRKVFAAVNQYPEKLIERIISNEKEIHSRNITKEQNNQHNNQDREEEEEEPKKETITLNLPYAGDQGEKIMRKLKLQFSSKKR